MSAMNNDQDNGKAVRMSLPLLIGIAIVFSLGESILLYQASELSATLQSSPGLCGLGVLLFVLLVSFILAIQLNARHSQLRQDYLDLAHKYEVLLASKLMVDAELRLANSRVDDLESERDRINSELADLKLEIQTRGSIEELKRKTHK